MKIELSIVTNAKLLQYFPSDPFGDFEIKSIMGEYKLQIAFLTIDSEYFEEMYNKNISAVDLSHLPQPYLEMVLKALYGDSLVVENFSDLTRVYLVVEALKIVQYKQKILNYLEQNMQSVSPIELLQFCCRFRVHEDAIKKLLIASDLRALEDRKHYLQLNKLSEGALVQLLNDYLNTSKNHNKQYIINGVLDCYFTRNKTDLSSFFAQPSRQMLLVIWEQWHPRIMFDRVLSTQATQSDQSTKVPLICDAEMLKKDERIRELELLLEQKQRDIDQLQYQNRQYSDMIGKLKEENLRLRETYENANSANIVTFDEDQPDRKNYKLVESLLPDNLRYTERPDSGRTFYCHTEPCKQQQDQDDELNYIEALPAKKLTPTQQLKTLNGLRATQRTKKIFDSRQQ